jgi:hypothetical protein
LSVRPPALRGVALALLSTTHNATVAEEVGLVKRLLRRLLYGGSQKLCPYEEHCFEAFRAALPIEAARILEVQLTAIDLIQRFSNDKLVVLHLNVEELLSKTDGFNAKGWGISALTPSMTAPADWPPSGCRPGRFYPYLRSRHGAALDGIVSLRRRSRLRLRRIPPSDDHLVRRRLGHGRADP